MSNKKHGFEVFIAICLLSNGVVSKKEGVDYYDKNEQNNIWEPYIIFGFGGEPPCRHLWRWLF